MKKNNFPRIKNKSLSKTFVSVRKKKRLLVFFELIHKKAKKIILVSVQSSYKTLFGVYGGVFDVQSRVH